METRRGANEFHGHHHLLLFSQRELPHLLPSVPGETEELKQSVNLRERTPLGDALVMRGKEKTLKRREGREEETPLGSLFVLVVVHFVSHHKVVSCIEGRTPLIDVNKMGGKGEPLLKG